MAASLDLARVAEASRAVAATSKRLEKIERLAACLSAAEPREVATVVAWLSGELHRGRIGVGPALVRRVARTPPAARASLSLAEVERALDDLAALQGRGSTAAREAALGRLFARATPEEQRFLAALLVGELRQGALEGVMVDAIARAARLPAAAVRRAVMLEGSAPAVARAALAEGEAGLARFAVRVFQPLKPMLASPAEGVEEALAQLDEPALEYKLDGARIQVHKEGDDVAVFTRSLRDVTAATPELVSAVRALPLRSAILDGETLALRPDGRPHPFQVTMRRFGRKLDVEALRHELPLRPFFFDALLLEGGDLLDAPLRERDRALAAAVPEGLRVPSCLAREPEQARAFLARALEDGHEGIMAKALASPYAAGARGSEWLKIKSAHTFDLVVLAAEWGSGRRRGWLSNLHLGARDPRSGTFVMVGKTFKGLSDALLEWQTAALLARETHREDHVVFVRPELVVEIAISDVQRSPHYPGGLALRFARVKRYRPDKSPEQADTLELLRELYARTLD
jgi:DNA ligase-1